MSFSMQSVHIFWIPQTHRAYAYTRVISMSSSKNKKKINKESKKQKRGEKRKISNKINHKHIYRPEKSKEEDSFFHWVFNAQNIGIRCTLRINENPKRNRQQMNKKIWIFFLFCEFWDIIILVCFKYWHRKCRIGNFKWYEKFNDVSVWLCKIYSSSKIDMASEFREWKSDKIEIY